MVTGGSMAAVGGPWVETSFSISVGVLRILIRRFGSIKFPWLLDMAVVRAV